MKLLFGRNKTFFVSYNPDVVAFVETKGNQRVTTFYPADLNKMPASVRSSYASRMRFANSR